MIKLTCFLIAEYASIMADNRLIIAGTLDNLNVAVPRDAPPDALDWITVPLAYLVAVTEASIADGLTHHLRLRVLNGNGEPITEPIVFVVSYSLNPYGRPLRHNTVIRLAATVFPGPDDYVFELSVEGQPGVLGDCTLSVTAVPSDG